MEQQRLEHQNLARLIKGVHKHLRRKFRESNGDYEAVWENHAQDDDRLKSYASAMKQLATDHWSEYPESRIDWCHEVIMEYFKHGGQLKALEKDAKHKFFESQRQREAHDKELFEKTQGNDNVHKGVSELSIERLTVSDSNASTETIQPQQCKEKYSGASKQLDHNQYCSGNPGQRMNGPDEACTTQNLQQSSESHHMSRHCTDEATKNRLQHPGSPHDISSHPDSLRLLDVGSCYNPFKNYQCLIPVAVDLYPADASVFQCDFLHLDVIPTTNYIPCQESNHQQDSKQTSFIDQLHSPIRQLPACGFDIVVFCLLLEYFPSPLQRARCCIKAVRLLKPNGLLLIITPDSKSPHRNSPMIKSWRSALAMLGMTRWKYHKMQHLHCMALRKVSEICFDDVSNLEHQLSQLLYIPQDFTDACYDDVERIKTDQEQQECLKTSRENEAFRVSVFEELPTLCDDID